MGYNNFVRCQLSASITSTDTSITLSSNTSPFNLPPTDGGTLVLADSINKPSKLEIITYTSRSGLVLTGVVRGAESTTAQSWPSSSYCYMSFTALMLTSFKADMSAALQTVVNKQDKHTNLTALSGITSGTGLFKRASDGSWVLDTTQYSTVTLASATPLAGSISGSVGTSLKAAKEDHTHPLQTSVSGNASTATKLASPISFTFTGGATGSLSSFDGSGNVTINLTVDAGGHTHGLATGLINGLMSSAQFTKLAGIADNANNYIHPVGAGYSHIPAAGTNVNRFLKSGTNDTYSWSLLSKTDVGLSNVDNTADANKPLSTAVTNALLNKVNTSLVGVAGGLATLDTNTKVPSSQLPNASSSIYGVVKLPTDTVNTNTANALSSVSNRTYQIQKNTGGDLVVNIPWTDTIYTHPVSGVTTGSYTKVTVDVNGHVIGGSNPTTLTGYGITDATPSSHIGSTGTSHGVASTSVNGFMSTSQVVSLNTAISDISTLQTTVAGKEPSFTVLPVTKGGTGVSSISGVLKGNGTSQLSAATSNDIVALVPDATTSQAGKMTTSQVSSLNELGGLVSLGSGVVKKTLSTTGVDTYSTATIADLVTSTNAVTNLNADMLDGLHVNHAGATTSAHIPFVGSGSVMEIGKCIDFHTVLGNDFELRLEAIAVTDSQSADLRVSGGRTASARVWHSDNHGANSGLDADKLDGNHASAFSLIGHTHDIATTSTAGFLSPANVEKLNALTVSRLLQVTTVDAPPVNTVHDLNNFISNGFFHHRLNSYASAGSNYPAPYAGMLKVIANDSMVYQWYHTYNNTGVYFRSKYNSSWYPWCKLFDTVNTTSNDIVALVPDATTIQAGKMTTTQVASLNTAVSSISTLQSGKEPLIGILPVSKGGTGVGTLSGVGYFNGTSPISAATSTQIRSLIGTSTSLMTGLNADLLDGNHASAFALSGHSHSTATTLADGFMSSTQVTSLNTAVSDISTLRTSKEDAFTTLPVSKGGTGVSTLTGIAKFNGTSQITAATSTDIVALVPDATASQAGKMTTSQVSSLNELGGLVSMGSGIVKKTLSTAGLDTYSTAVINDLVTSTTLVPNLNADLLDGKHASEFSLSGHSHGTLDSIAGTGVGLLVKTSTSGVGTYSSAQIASLTTTGLTVSGLSTNGLINLSLDTGLDNFAGFSDNSANVGLVKLSAVNSFAKASSSDIVALLPDATTSQSGKMTTSQVTSLNELGGLVSMGSGIVKKTLSTSGVDTYSTAAISDLVTSTNVVTNLNADMLDGLHVNNAGLTTAAHIPFIGSDGVIEIGKYIDFHPVLGNGFEVRLEAVQVTTSQSADLRISGGKTASAKVWHADNVGANSGLDADLLDGNHASAFALSDHIHSNVTTLANGFMSSTDKSRIDLLNLSSTESLTKVAGIDAIYSGIANLSRTGSRITLDIPNGATLTTHRSYKGGEFTCNTYLENSSEHIQATFGVVGYGNMYGGTGAPGHLAARVYGGYNVASVACTSDVNNYVYRMVGTYSGVSVDATKSKVSSVYGNFIELTGSGETTTTTGYVTNAYGLFINASSIDPYTTNLYSIYCDASTARGYLAGDLCIGVKKPNRVDGGLILGGQFIYLYKPNDVTGAYYGADLEGIVAGLESNNTHVLHTPYGFKFGNAYSTTRESADSQTLDWYEEASVTLTSSGLTTNTTATAKLTRNGNLVAIDVPTITGAGTSTTFKLTGIPIQFRPLVAKEFLVRGTIGEVVSICRAIINTSGEIQVYAGLNSETFSTTSSTRGINKISLSYQLH